MRTGRQKKDVHYKLSKIDKDILQLVFDYGDDIIKTENYTTMEEYVQHGAVSVRRHSVSVAYASVRLARKLGVSCDEKLLVRGALLHDYFLYDWHEKSDWHKLHGFRHANIALQNAVKDFELGRIEQEIIKKHMWPLTVVPPKCREAWLVVMADKYCSLLETFYLYRGRRQGKIGKRQEKNQDDIFI